jgi:hypothetical protein
MSRPQTIQIYLPAGDQRGMRVARVEDRARANAGWGEAANIAIFDLMPCIAGQAVLSHANPEIVKKSIQINGLLSHGR